MKPLTLKVAVKPRIMSSRSSRRAITIAEDKMHDGSKMALSRNAGTTREMTSYVRCFLKHTRYKAAGPFAMMVLLVLESIS